VLKATWVEQEDDRYVASGSGGGGGGGGYPPVSGDREIELHGTVANLNTNQKCFDTREVKVCYISGVTKFYDGTESDLTALSNGLGPNVEVKGVRSSSGGYVVQASRIQFSND
jgi:hypothetical protein